MKKTVKQVLGIDVAQNELVVSLGRMLADLSIEIYAYEVFSNREKDFSGLLSWVEKRVDVTVPVRYVMEATGVYHEALAYFLDQAGQEVSLVLPNKISHYFKSLEVKTITDKTSSQTIAQFGLERKLEVWHRPQAIFKSLRQLTRERSQVMEERTVVMNQLHAEQAEAQPNASSLVRIKKRIALLTEQALEIKKEIALCVKNDPPITQALAILCSIPGVAMLTAATVLAETNGFEHVRNRRQLTSYAGLDVREKQSGTSVKGKTHISKRGNKYLRKAVHMPALAAIRSEDRFKNVFINLVSKHGIKMKGVVAVQRKLLEMMYTLHKKKEFYQPTYLQKSEEQSFRK
jgi:transposase